MTIEKQENGWELNNGSYYKWNDAKEKLEASIIYHSSQDGKHTNSYGVQIYTSDGSLLDIGYIAENNFHHLLAKGIADMALRENKDFEWWRENYRLWWQKNVVLG